MVDKKIYIEGGGVSKDLNTRCRQAFRKLFEKCGFVGRMPKLVASGSWNQAFKGFCTAHKSAGNNEFVALLWTAKTR